MSEKFKTSIGGQAVIEGIVMKGPEKTCLAVRKPDGSIHTEVSATRKNKVKKIPLVRGAVMMVLSLIEGYKSIMRATELAFPEGEVEEDKLDKFFNEKFGEKAGGVLGLIAGVLGSFLAIALFIVIPTALTGLLSRFVEMSNLLMSVIEGLLKLVIFIGYLFLVTRIKDIHRVFEFHGAEHKTIACYEHGEALTVENVKKHSRFHPRCGTSFIFIVIILSIIIFAFVPWISTLFRALIKLLAIPLIMGIAYEILRFSGSHDNFFCRMLATPGLWVQRLTTFEPDDKQIEVAIASLEAVIPEDSDKAKW